MDESLLPEPRCFVVEIAFSRYEKYMSPGFDQIQAELIQAGYEILGPKSVST
jgi:hypothetical protein